MRKNQTLFTMALLVLLGSMGAAQAQDPRFAEVKLFTTPEPFAREGGKNEAAGSIHLSVSGAMAEAIRASTIMLHFSVPLAADIDAKGERRRRDGSRGPRDSDGYGGERG